MPKTIRAVPYCYVTVPDRPGEACRVLSELAAAGINLFAFHVLPGDTEHTRLAIFPDDMDHMLTALASSSLDTVGPFQAILIQGDDELGALVEIHRVLHDAGINVVASTGIADSSKGFGYIIHVREQDIERALHIIGS